MCRHTRDDSPAGTCPESPATLSTGPPVKPGLDRLVRAAQTQLTALAPGLVNSSPVCWVGSAAHARLYWRAGTRAPSLPRRLRSGSEWARRSRLARVSAVPTARSCHGLPAARAMGFSSDNGVRGEPPAAGPRHPYPNCHLDQHKGRRRPARRSQREGCGMLVQAGPPGPGPLPQPATL